jgi:2-C-methyl-D-erythritol 4-phosphate cytidylyltransferase
MNYGIIMAAGRGMRFGGPKQFVRLQGRSLLVRVLEAFEHCAAVAETVVVTNPERLKYVEHLAARAHCRKVKWVIAGGERRQDSVERGLRVLPGRGMVAIHDAARPTLRPEHLSRGFAVCRRTRAAIYAMPVTETLKRVSDSMVRRTVTRDDLFLAQTPQFFALDLIKTAHENARRRGWCANDDAELVERLGALVTVVPGWPGNIKITTRHDLRLVAAVMAFRQLRKRG